MEIKELKNLIDVVAKLRAPDGCPWDREQTHKSLKPNMLEEAYETIDAIDSNDMDNLREELGDVLLQVVLHAQIASEEGLLILKMLQKSLKKNLSTVIRMFLEMKKYLQHRMFLKIGIN